jgi:FkbM family methyltransferase
MPEVLQLTVPRSRQVVNITADEIGQLVNTDSPVIVEVGANDGTDTERFLDAMPGAKIICFEPDPRPLARFACRHDERVTLIQVAIAERTKQVELIQSGGRNPIFADRMPNSGDPADWDLSSSLMPATPYLADRHKWLTFDKTTSVDAVALDTYRSMYYPHVDFHWADVQGAEALLILGGQETLRHTRFFYTEYYNNAHYHHQPDLNAIRAFLPGWEQVRLFKDNVLFWNTNYRGRQI